MNPEPYIDICLYDTCACESVGDCACFCDTIAAYAHACAQKGVAVHWRSPTLCRKYRKHEAELSASMQGFGSDWSDLALFPLTCREFHVNGAGLAALSDTPIPCSISVPAKPVPSIRGGSSLWYKI